jgi:ribonuclease Z
VLGLGATLPDGRVIDPDQVLGPPRPGTRYVHVGDVGKTDNLREICQDADALVIESTYMNEEAELADAFAHMTARRAAELAQATSVKHLLLTHVSRRYREHDVIDEARAIFPNAYVVRDFDHFQIKRGECIKVEREK